MFHFNNPGRNPEESMKKEKEKGTESQIVKNAFHVVYKKALQV